METWLWSKLKTRGKIPHARRFHAACCIAGPLTGQTHSLLMVSRGLDAESFKALSDVWILDVAQCSWSKQEALPTNRCGHSAVTFGIGPDFRVVVLFGGSKGFDEGSLRWPGRVTVRFQIAPLPNCSAPLPNCAASKLRRFQIGLNSDVVVPSIV